LNIEVKEMTYEKLIEAAITAREKAYAPYSGFKVGAALLAEDGQVYTGCNVENASYSHTICAERAAVFNAVSAGARNFKAIAIVSEGEIPASPCGGCRQVLAEFSPGMRVLMANTKGQVVASTVRELLPLHFDANFLKGGPNA
jgi:cytidine deaminase